MLATARRATSYPNPDRSDRPDIPAHLGYLAAAIDVDVLYVQGTDAARLARAHQTSGGLFFWCTDTKLMWYDDGATWQQNTNGANLIGTYSALPAANSVPAGTQYSSTDTLGVWRSNGTTWALIAQGSPLVSVAAFGSAPYTSPYDGQRVRLQVDATNGIEWHFCYNSGSASAYKWEFIGGPWMETAFQTSSESPGVSYADFGTVLSITLPRGGDYEIEGRARNADNSNTSSNSVDLNIAGSDIGRDYTWSAGNATNTSNWSNGAYVQPSYRTGLAASAVIKLRRKATASTATTWQDGHVRVRPVRIS